MKRVSQWLWLIAFLADGLIPGRACGESRNHADYEEAHALLVSIEEQAKAERKICEEELARGVEQNRWSDDDRRAGLAWLELSFTDPWTDETAPGSPLSIRRAFSPWADFMKRLDETRGPIVLENEACVWLYERINALHELRDAAARQMRGAGLAYCEDVWMEASGPADMGPVIRVLSEIRQLHPAHWASVAFRRKHPIGGQGSSTKPRFQVFTDEEMSEAFDFWNLLAPAEPFLLPDPAKDLATFREASSQWQALLGVRHRFLARPRVAAYFFKSRAEYSRHWEVAREELNDMILADAPPAEFEKTLLRVAGKPPNPEPNRQPAQNYPPPGPLKDFRELIANQVVRPRPEGSETQAFRNWLYFRRAEEAGDAESMVKFARELDFPRCKFSSRVALHVLQRVTPYLGVNSTSSANADGSRNSPPAVDDSIKRIVAILEGKPEQREIAAAWREVQARSTAEDFLHSEFVSEWRKLASKPDSKSTFDLRERAARQALASIMKNSSDESDDQSVTSLLIDALEQSCAMGAKAQILRLLTVNRAYCGLWPELDKAYVSIAAQMPDLVEPTSDRERSVAITKYRRLLTQSASPAAARYAADQLKRLRQQLKESADSQKVPESK